MDEESQNEYWRSREDLLAKMLDSMVRVPGTNLWIGIDPMLGLIPGIGDMLSHIIGSALLYFAAKLQIPRIVHGLNGS